MNSSSNASTNLYFGPPRDFVYVKKIKDKIVVTSSFVYTSGPNAGRLNKNSYSMYEDTPESRKELSELLNRFHQNGTRLYEAEPSLGIVPKEKQARIYEAEADPEVKGNARKPVMSQPVGSDKSGTIHKSSFLNESVRAGEHVVHHSYRFVRSLLGAHLGIVHLPERDFIGSISKSPVANVAPRRSVRESISSLNKLSEDVYHETYEKDMDVDHSNENASDVRNSMSNIGNVARDVHTLSSVSM